MFLNFFSNINSAPDQTKIILLCCRTATRRRRRKAVCSDPTTRKRSPFEMQKSSPFRITLVINISSPQAGEAAIREDGRSHL